MSKLLSAMANDDHTLLIEFEYGNKVVFNMKKLVKTMPYRSLNDLDHFKNLTIENKTIIWPNARSPDGRAQPVKITVDDILFTIRE